VSYTFYVEHSHEKLQGAVNFDMSKGVRAVLDRFLAGEEDILAGHAKNDELMIEKVVAKMVSPMEIGYLCYPTPPEVCTPISVDVTATHRSTASSEIITFGFLRQSMHLPALIDVSGYTIEYVGDRAVETKSQITLGGVPDREMKSSELEHFEGLVQEFLDKVATRKDVTGSDSLRILSVNVNGQEITSEVEMMEDNEASLASRNIAGRGRRRLKKANNIQVSVKGKYRPPPEVDFGSLIEESINRDRELLQKEIRKNPPPQEDSKGGETGYFDNIEVVGAREVKTIPLSTTLVDDQGGKSGLKFAAIGVGACIVLLSITFFLRPHRRNALFGSRKDDQRHMTQPIDSYMAQPIDEDAQDFLRKSRLRSSGSSDGLTDSATSYFSDTAKKHRQVAESSFISGQEKAPYLPDSSHHQGGHPLLPVENFGQHNSMPPAPQESFREQGRAPMRGMHDASFQSSQQGKASMRGYH